MTGAESVSGSAYSSAGIPLMAFFRHQTIVVDLPASWKSAAVHEGQLGGNRKRNPKGLYLRRGFLWESSAQRRGGRIAATGGLAAALILVGLLGAVISLAQTTPQRRSKRYRPPPALPLTKFYDTPAPLVPGKPGELIRSEPSDDYALPPEVSAVRILYHSRSATGDDVAASGVVLVPEGKPPTSGWPVIAWAHGFSGVARQCAPSLMRNVYYGAFLSMYVRLGYAIVATDYAGLGSNFRNAAMDMQSSATDVINSIPAARSALPQLGARWVALGDSEGGTAAVAVAELENQIGDPNYLGSVAVSGLGRGPEFYLDSAPGASASKLLALAYGIKTVYPQFAVEEMLTEKALPFYRQIDGSCEAGSGAMRFLAAEMLQANWQQNELVRKFFSRNVLGEVSARAPILVLSGAFDSEFSKAGSAALARLCKQKDRVMFYSYPGLDRESVLGSSVPDQITWVQARFRGQSPPTSCR
jgi:Secretory lipase